MDCYYGSFPIVRSKRSANNLLPIALTIRLSLRMSSIRLTDVQPMEGNEFDSLPMTSYLYMSMINTQ